MRQYNGFESKKMAGGYEPLPAGGYVVKLIDAKVEQNSNGSESLVIAYDVAEGEYTGHYRDAFNSDTRADRKWRGTYRLFIPTGDGSEKDGWSVNSFNNLIACLEESNPGYHWDWNEKGLKGKLLGLVYRNKEWEYEGKTGWTTEAASVYAAQDIRDGKFKAAKDKPLRNKPAQNGGFSGFGGGAVSAADFAELDGDDDDLPF